MFNKSIRSNDTQLTTIDADSYFADSVFGSDYQGDFSFIATLRALVYPRMISGEKISVCFTSSSFYTGGISHEEILNRIISETNPRNHQTRDLICVHSFEGSSEDNNKYFKVVEELLEEKYKHWSRLEKVTELYKESFKVDCFINEEHKNVVLFIDNLDIRKMHYIQCGILGFLPWYFDTQTGVTADEKALMYSLTKKNANEYIQCINKIAMRYDFREAKVRRLLDGFETKVIKLELDSLKREIKDLYNQINSLNNQIGDKLGIISNDEIRVLGIESKINENNGNSEIMDYFLSNKNIELESVYNDTIYFSCRGYVDFFDEDLAKRVIENKTSYVYYPDDYDGDDYIPNEDMQSLMKAIFIDQELRIKFCAGYYLNLAGQIYPQGGHAFSNEFDDCMPNPHIDRYECMGNYSRVINELLAKHDYTMAIEQCIASCKSLNFGDSAVMDVFMKRVYGIDTRVNRKFIELPNGETVTPIEAIKWLKEENDE